MSRYEEAFERAFAHLPFRRTFQLSPDRRVIVACLIRVSDWRPLKAPWWRKKDACIIGADLGGNFFLRHCDGGVRYWDHKTQTDTKIAASVQEFCGKLEETPEIWTGFRPDEDGSSASA